MSIFPFGMFFFSNELGQNFKNWRFFLDFYRVSSEVSIGKKKPREFSLLIVGSTGHKQKGGKKKEKRKRWRMRWSSGSRFVRVVVFFLAGGFTEFLFTGFSLVGTPPLERYWKGWNGRNCRPVTCTKRPQRCRPLLPNFPLAQPNEQGKQLTEMTNEKETTWRQLNAIKNDKNRT